MFDGMYFWNLVWSFFTLLALVFVPVFIVMIYFVTRTPRARSGPLSSSADADAAAAGPLRENRTERAA